MGRDATRQLPSPRRDPGGLLHDGSGRAIFPQAAPRREICGGLHDDEPEGVLKHGKDGDGLMAAEDKFHNHLDRCDQCANNPFNLCLIGHLLLKNAVAETADKGLRGLLQWNRVAGKRES